MVGNVLFSKCLFKSDDNLDKIRDSLTFVLVYFMIFWHNEDTIY